MNGILVMLRFAPNLRGAVPKPPTARWDFRSMTRATCFCRPFIRPRARAGRPSCFAVDGCISSDLGNGTSVEIDEVRRPFYVALTRASTHLRTLELHSSYIFITQQDSMGDRHLGAARTQFIAQRLLPQLESTTGPRAKVNRSGTRATQTLVTRIRGKARSAWR